MFKKVYGEATALPAIAAQWQSLDCDKYQFKLHPELWTNVTVNQYFQGRTWSAIEFKESNQPTVPSVSGVYMFIAQPHLADLCDHTYIFYVGKATSLRQRYGDYLKEKRCLLQHNRQHVVKFLNHLERHLYFHYTCVPDYELDRAEGYLKDNIDPPANVQTDILGRLETTQ